MNQVHRYVRRVTQALQSTRPAAFVLLFAFFGAALPASAQQRISFEDAIRIALDQNIDLKKSENSLVLSENDVKSAKANFLPNLNANAGGGRNWGLSFDQTAGRLVTESSDNASGSISSSVNLFNGFSDVAALSQARYNYMADEQNLQRAEQTVYFRVVEAYLQILLAQEQVGIRQEDLQAQQQQLTQIEEFTRLGARPISDLYQQQATAAQSELSLVDAERALDIAKVRLIQVLELDPFQEYEFDAPKADELDLDVTSYNLEEILRTALENRADLQALSASLDAAQQGIRIAKSNRYPTLNLSGNYGTSYSSQRQDDFSGQLKNNRSQSVRLSLNVPIFNRLNTRTTIQRSEINFVNQQLDLQNYEQSVLLEVRQAYSDYTSLAKQLEVSQIQLAAAQQAQEVEQERYNVGASTLVELTNARANYVRAASNRAQVIFQFVFQSRLLDYYIGILDPNASVF